MVDGLLHRPNYRLRVRGGGISTYKNGYISFILSVKFT